MRKLMRLSLGGILVAALVSGASPTPSRADYWGHCQLDSGSGFQCFWECESGEWCCWWSWDCM